MKVKIISKGLHPKDTEIELDGQLITKYTSSITINSDIYNPPNEIILRLLPTCIEYEGEAAAFANIGGNKYRLLEDK
jgi:hypothetical protein